MSKDNPKTNYVAVLIDNAGKPLVRNLHTMTTEEAVRFHAADANLRFWLQGDMESYAILQYSCRRFKAVVQRVRLETQRPTMPDGRDELVAINTEFLSFLSMMRLYLDHSASRIGSKNPNELKIHKEATNMEFDNHFSYRFFSQLRNYAQHKGMPITGLNAKRELSDDKTEAIYTFDVYFIRSELLEIENIWTAKVLPDIQSSPEHIRIMPLLTEVTQCLDRIRFKTFMALKPFIEDDVEFMRVIAVYASSYDSDPFIMDVTRVHDDSRADLHARKVPIKLINYYDNLVESVGQL
jgi:hypothetical protein